MARARPMQTVRTYGFAMRVLSQRSASGRLGYAQSAPSMPVRVVCHAAGESPRVLHSGTMDSVGARGCEVCPEDGKADPLPDYVTAPSRSAARRARWYPPAFLAGSQCVRWGAPGLTQQDVNHQLVSPRSSSRNRSRNRGRCRSRSRSRSSNGSR